MGKENELLQLVKAEDVAGVTRLLNKLKVNKPKLLGTGRRMNLNTQDADGLTALHQAALLGNGSILTLLLEGGANVDMKDNRGMRPLHLAAWQGQGALVSLLLQWNSSVNDAALDGSTPLHLAAQYGHLDVVERLLCQFHANPALRNKDFKSPLDLACEFGRLQIVELLLSSNRCLSLLEERPEDTADNQRTTCLHLAAKNGHLDIIRCLLRNGVDINRSTLRGSCLHEAALYGRYDVVQLLIESGVDVNKPNSYDQTALDIVKTMTSSSRAGRDIRQLLKEASNAALAVSVRDYHPLTDPQGLSLREGEQVTVLEQKEDGRWRGVVFGDNYSSRSGYFPSSAVALINRQVSGGGGMAQQAQRSKGVHAKKVAPPVVPGQDIVANRNSTRIAVTSAPPNNRDMCDNGMYISISDGSPVLAPTSYTAQHVAQVLLSPRRSLGEGVASEPSSPHPLEGSTLPPPPLYQQQTSLEDQGIDVQSPGRDSPGSSGSSSGSGCRHSITSLDSGRASSSAYDGRCGQLFLSGVNQQHRLSGHSYESSSSLRQSYHSSSSSLGSMDRLDSSTPSTPAYSPANINVSKLLRDGLPECEVLRRWLCEQRFEEYFHLFIQAGYDLPTISRMTPEDLTAIGITNPAHRKKLKVEIGKLNISDGLPEYLPSCVDEWLRALRLEEYAGCLQQQGYNRLSDVLGIAWEDLEEIGIQRLGHQKKMMLAIKRLKDIQSGVKRFSSVATAEQSPPPAPPPPPHPFNGYSASPSHLVYRPDIVAIQVRHPSGARSLENLEDNRENNKHQTFLQDTRWPPPVPTIPTSTASSVVGGMTWRRGSLDDGEVTPTNDSYELEGGGTLPRPKVSIKPRPVAKIMAKSRVQESEGRGEEEGGNGERDETDIMKESELRSESGGSCVTVSAEVHNSPRGGTLRMGGGVKKVPPPPPPKRNCLVGDKRPVSDYSSEQLFASCVKNMASKFGLSRGGEWGLSVRKEDSSPSDEGSDFSLEMTEAPDCTPPSPAPGSPVHQRPANRASTFLANRTESGSSFESVASTFSSSSSSSSSESQLPFANENVGTIRQKSIKAHPTLTKMDLTPRHSNTTPRSAPATPKRRSSLKKSPASPSGPPPPPHVSTEENLRRSPSENALDQSGDVLSDIDHMLANLSEELDAMLTHQLAAD